MTIDFAHFTPRLALAGSLLIGISTAIYLLGNGRIAGISGMLGRLIDRQAACHQNAEMPATPCAPNARASRQSSRVMPPSA